MSILEKLENVQNIIPSYWPIGSFIHHNPLKGFEHLHFKDGVKEAKNIFGGKVYMDPIYYINLFNEGKIDKDIFEDNLLYALKQRGLEKYFHFAEKYFLEVSQNWNSIKNILLLDENSIDIELYNYHREKSIYQDRDKWYQSLTKKMTMYELHDALFGTNIKESVHKNTIEYISRFLDEDQTTMEMPNRNLGMFETFKLYEDMDYKRTSVEYVEYALEKLGIKNKQNYLLTKLLKLHGWAGFIKYRSNDNDYFAQQKHPSSLIDFIAVGLYYELKYLENRKFNCQDTIDGYFINNQSETIIKILKYKDSLPGEYVDRIENKQSYDKILDRYIVNKLNFDTLRIQYLDKQLHDDDIDLVHLSELISAFREEEGYIWVKSLEDTYIKNYVDDFTEQNPKEEQALASATFCLDVRSEVIRRHVEAKGDYQTYGAGGFLGIPLAFVEFDKAHEQFLAPAIVKPTNVVFELPKESSDEYKSKKGINKTTKKVLSDLKNNPYTPYIMVEAIGWLFGINLFGKTFAPQKTNKLFKKFKAEKPKTTYTIDKLSDDEIDFYINKLHTTIIRNLLESKDKHDYTKEEIDEIWRHLVFEEKLTIVLPHTIIDKLQHSFQITPKDYEYQRNKLQMVGFTLEEKVMYLQKYLTMIGQVNNFPEFVTIIGHGSVSDNNPFESALDCGACGGNISLPNTRALCMIANDIKVREAIKNDHGIEIPENTKFIPGFHLTTTDEITFYDTDVLSAMQLQKFEQVALDFNAASQTARTERGEKLPFTNNDADMMKRTTDWSEPRPEWGLAKNMGVFAGPRKSVKHLNLDNRFFMHSYDHSIDNKDADILTRIFNGPLVVGEWINLEHYFSTVDNDIYGAGSKVYHNIVSKIGVYSGNYSDLKIGLPTQSVELEGKAYHEPIRLLTFMEAPLDIVGQAVENSIAKEFILNEWIRPVIIDKDAKKVYSYENGEFKVIKEL
jgi:uncharacterized protein YbcC (UPF0753/DUF2309 family)